MLAQLFFVNAYAHGQTLGSLITYQDRHRRQTTSKAATMKSQSLHGTAAASLVVFFLSIMAVPAAAAVVEHTFTVSQMNMTRLCTETLVTVVNGQLPGPMIEVMEGDSVAVHIVNKSPYNITIHWHGVKQKLNCWADGVPMITQCPILPNQNSTYRFNISGQEGTLWWHAHDLCLRASLHGAFIIRPRNGASSYPFPKPHKDIPIIIGEWWEKELAQVDTNMRNGFFADEPSASTINGKVGDLYNCSGALQDGYVLDVEPGKTYLLRVLNAALFHEYYFRIAGHKFTVVAADANYVNPYTTDILAISPGQTVDALVIADAPPRRGMLQYKDSHIHGTEEIDPYGNVPVVPGMPDMHDKMVSFYFHGNLTALEHPRRRTDVDEHLFLVLGVGKTSCRRAQSCTRRKDGSDQNILVATMNNASFELHSQMTSLLEAHYYHTIDMDALQELPDRPPREFNYTDRTLVSEGPKEELLEQTSKATVARRLRHGAAVEVVFQSTALLQKNAHPMHLHGYDMFVVAQGLGNYDPEKDVVRYNLVNPPLKNTVAVPNLGWAAVRFVADNPGVWFLHSHFQSHLSMGMAAVFLVEDGPTAATSLPPPPADFPRCGLGDNSMPHEYYFQTRKDSSDA
ncbi:unnamed protein product [Urochloa decumbens]|uniref:laccase n=1 Tax=Urochloa decumbens TaxID=240449 RepID=A0ABC9B9A4_9POAL